MRSRSRGPLCPRFASSFAPQKSGRREGRVLAGTRGLVCNKRRENAHEHTGISRGIRPSLRNGLTAYAALSLETNSSCLHRRRIGGSHRPVGLLQTSADLTPATGAGTTRFCRTQLRRSSDTRRRSRGNPPCDQHHAPGAFASTAARPNVRDDRDTPLLRAGMARVLRLIWVAREQDSFFARDWTGQISLK